jgi:DNA-binding MarR family transcriptional regulator
VELTNRLESAGFVKRQPDPEDGRQILLRLTPLGAAKLRSLSLAHRDELLVKGPELAKTLRNILRGSRKSHAA